MLNLYFSYIFHHFGNKEGLWKAVKKNIIEEANKLSLTLPETNQPFADFLKELVSLNIAFYRNNPDIVRMINWQRLEYGNKKEIGITLSKEAKAWLAALKHYQEKGAINIKLKLEFVLTFTLSIISSTAMDPNAFVKQTEGLKDYIDFVVEKLLKAFK